MSKPAIFLDRDGTLIVDAGYPSQPDQVKIIPECIPVLKNLQSQGYILIVISNQSGIGRGIITEDEASAVQNRFLELFAQHDLYFDGYYFCPHSPEENCSCRKPRPGLLIEAQEDLSIDLSKSYMIGDKRSDVEAGQNAGCAGILYNPDSKEYGISIDPDAEVHSWQEIISYIEKNGIHNS